MSWQSLSVLLFFYLCVAIYLLYQLMAFLFPNLLRIRRICDHYEDFIRKNKEVTTIKQGFHFSKLCKCLRSLIADIIIFLVNIIQPLKTEDGICRPYVQSPYVIQTCSVKPLIEHHFLHVGCKP